MNKRPTSKVKTRLEALLGAIFILSMGGTFASPAFADKPPTHGVPAHGMRLSASRFSLSAEKSTPLPVPEPAPFEVLTTESVKSKPVDPLIQEQLRRAKNSLSGVTGVHTVIPGRTPGIAR